MKIYAVTGTNKRAFMGSTCFDKKTSNSGHIRQIGGDIWSVEYFSFETEELKTRLIVQISRDFVRNLDIRTLTDEQCIEIHKLLSK